MQKLNRRNFFQKNTHICNHYVTQIRKHYLFRFEDWHKCGTILCHNSKCLKVNVFKGKRHFDIVEVASSSLATPTNSKSPSGRFFFMKKRTCDLDRGSRIKTTGVAVVLTARGEVLLDLGADGRRRSKS